MENLIEKWVNEDRKLYDLLVEIQSRVDTPHEMAEIAFEELCGLYGIPKMPAEVVEDDEDEIDFENPLKGLIDKRSLFEEHTLIKYLSEENEDPRGMVLSAAWHLLNDYRVDLWQVAKKEFGDNIPERCQIGVRGEGIYGEVVFPQKEDKSWFELGCLKNNLLTE